MEAELIFRNDREVDLLERLLEAERAEVRRLTNLIIDLKREGFGVVPPAEPPEVDPLDDQVIELMHQAGFEDSDPAWRQNARYVRQKLERDPNVDRQQLIEDILKGDDPFLHMD